MSGQYIFDKDNFKFRRARISVWSVLRKLFMYLIASLSLAVLYYLIFALIISTDSERRIRNENKMYEREYPALEQKSRLVSDVISGLQARDNAIFEEIFHTSAPSIDPMSSVNFLTGLDTIPDMDIVSGSAARLDALERHSAVVEDNFREVMEIISSDDYVMPPMTNPLKDFSYAQTGASVGDKINPFYKVAMKHDGLDMISHSGEPVYASAPGLVSDIIRSRKGLGNVVVIDHGNGYRTRYAHLADVEARKGRRVKLGERIGYVGVSGNSFAPHLHYEVIRDTVVCNPVNHMFASVTPDEYMNMMVMSVSVGQSMD